MLATQEQPRQELDTGWVAELARRDFSVFVREFWPTIIAEPLRWNWHITLLCDELQKVAERVIRREPKEYDLIINVPPGTSKSTIATIMFPVWCWVRDPSLRFITGSYSSALALEHADFSRDVIRSPKFREWYPDVRIQRDKDNKGNYKVAGKGGRFSTSVGGTVMGSHAHIIVVDDPVNPRQALSDVERGNANKWLDQTLSTRKVDKAITPLILIMQRLHVQDCTGHLLDKAHSGKGIRHICLPGEVSDDVAPEVLRRYYTDGLLDPSRLPREVLSEMEADLGAYAYAGQVMQRPIPSEGGMFDVGKFVIVDAAPALAEQVRAWDKAGTEGGGAATAGVLVGKTRGGKAVILDVVRGHWGAASREDRIEQTARLDGTDTKIYVEQEPGSGGKESAESTIKRLAGFRAYAERVTGSKEVRAEPYAAQVSVGNVLVLNKPWTREFIAEHEYFPQGRYRDQVDAAAMGFNKLFGLKKKAGVW